MKGIDKHILKNIGEKLAEKEKLTFQEKQAKLEKLSDKEIELLNQILDIIEAAGGKNNLSEAEIKQINKLWTKLGF